MILGVREKIYETTAKIFYKGINNETLILHYKDERGIQRNKISANFWLHLAHINIKNHFIKILSSREQLIYSTKVPNLSIMIHNIALNDLNVRLGVDFGYTITRPLLEWHISSAELNNPIVAKEHIICFELLDDALVDKALEVAEKLANAVKSCFYLIGLIPATIEMKFGVVEENKVCLISDISPETVTLWSKKDMCLIDKDKVYEIMEKLFMLH